jgi:PAS domain S-box-containing protein
MTERLQGTVLYVDDDAANRHAFVWLFRRAGFDVKEAATGGDALRLLAEKPDLVVLDVNLPDIDGFEVCRRIKAHPATTAIPVLHLSAVHVQPEDKRHGLAEGADVYLTKPVDPQDLLAQARALVRIHRVEERARAAARQWQTTFDALDDGVCLLDRQGRVVRGNRALLRLVGKSLGQVLGRPCHELTPVAPGRGEAPALRRMLATRSRQAAEFVLAGRWLRAVAEPLLGPDGGLAGAVYILSDVTERKGLEGRLRQGEKLAAAGRLAAEVAHDINNLVTAVTGNVALLLAAAPDQAPDRAALRAVDQAAWRAAELARQLMKSARRGPAGLRPTDPRECLEEVADMLRRTLGPRIALEVRAGPGLWPVQADPGQVSRALMNLCANARDAMPQGGHLLLEAENAVPDAGQARPHPAARPGEFVRLRVRDSGPGIPAEVLPRIFEPFFTTKEPQQGTGLGLAVVADIVGQHQGWVESSSAPNQGTCFDIYLPRAPGAVSACRGNTGTGPSEGGSARR